MIKIRIKAKYQAAGGYKLDFTLDKIVLCYLMGNSSSFSSKNFILGLQLLFCISNLKVNTFLIYPKFFD